MNMLSLSTRIFFGFFVGLISSLQVSSQTEMYSEVETAVQKTTEVTRREGRSAKHNYSPQVSLTKDIDYDNKWNSKPSYHNVDSEKVKTPHLNQEGSQDLPQDKMIDFPDFKQGPPNKVNSVIDSGAYPSKYVIEYPNKRSREYAYFARPGTYHNNIPLGKSGSNVEWSVWHTEGDSPEEPNDKKGPMSMPKPKEDKASYSPEFHHYHHFLKPMKPDDAMKPKEMMMPWKGSDVWQVSDAWKPDDAFLPWDGMNGMMMMMHPDMKNGKKGGFLDRFSSLDPMHILIAGVIPLSLLLAACLPMLMNIMMTSNPPMPTITTTATGKDGARRVDVLPNAALESFLKSINAFGALTIDEPHCFQKIFCQMTKGGEVVNEETMQKVFGTASDLVDDYWLETLGLKKLFEAMADGDCDSVPCTSSNAEILKTTPTNELLADQESPQKNSSPP